MASSAQNKKQLRSEIRQACLLMPPAEKLRQSRQIFKNLESVSQLNSANTLLAYIGIKHEIDTIPFLEYWINAGKTLILPKVEAQRTLSLYRIRNLKTDLVAGYRDIPEPNSDTCEIWKDKIDIILTPGVAFTLTGKRLGQGGGFYDTLLPDYPNTLKISMALSPQLVSDLPSEAHDQSVDILVTADDIIMCN